MPNPPPPLPNPKEQFDGVSDIFAPISQFKDIQRFVKTRRAIIRGDTLYNNSKDQLATMGFLGPWKFNIVQSVICSIPGMTVAAIAWIAHPNSAPLTSAADPVKLKILSLLEPLRVPFTFLVLAYVIGLCAIPSGFITKWNWRTAQRKYLYLDGAYGALPQLILSISVAIISLEPRPILTVLLQMLAVTAFLVVSLWQLSITVFRVGNRMFEYDYITNKNTMFASALEQPTVRYYMVALPGLVVFNRLLSLVLDKLSSLLAAIVHHLR